MEGDEAITIKTDAENDFNPLPPHGGRQCVPISSTRSAVFQSTPSAWRETIFSPAPSTPFVISIHSLRMEGDWVKLTV